MRSQFLATAAITTLALTSLLFPISPASAQTEIFATGFEASEGYSTTVGAGPVTISQEGVPIATINRAAGALLGQPSTDTRRYTFIRRGVITDIQDTLERAVNSTKVVDTVAASGNQSVEIVGATLGAQNIRYVAAQNLVAGAGGVLNVSVDVRVTNPSADVGQWGIALYRSTPDFLETVAAFGFVGGQVLASNDGFSAYAVLDAQTFAPITANYDDFNNYALQMNFDTRSISGLFNGAPVVFLPLDFSNNPIGPPVLEMPFQPFADDRVDYATFGQASFGTDETGYFDNLRIAGTNITTNAPEPGSLVFVGAVLIGGLARRRAHKSQG